MLKERFILLDRDGVINQDSDAFIKSPEEWFPIPGSLEAIALLNEHGYRVVVVTNQSGIARGLFDVTTLDKIHKKMQTLVAEKGGLISAIYYCPHGPDDACNCRKPRPGMLLDFARDYLTDLSDVPVIGDSLRDLQAASVVGALPILVRTGKGEKTLLYNPQLTTLVFENLYEAAKFIIARP